MFFYVKPCPAIKEEYNENVRNFQFVTTFFISLHSNNLTTKQDYDRANPATDDYARKLFVEKESEPLKFL